MNGRDLQNINFPYNWQLKYKKFTEENLYSTATYLSHMQFQDTTTNPFWGLSNLFPLTNSPHIRKTTTDTNDLH